MVYNFLLSLMQQSPRNTRGEHVAHTRVHKFKEHSNLLPWWIRPETRRRGIVSLKLYLKRHI